MEKQARKGIQVSYLATNFAEKMHNRVQEVGGTEYGETFYYSDVFLGKDENEIFAVEEFVEGVIIPCSQYA